MKNKGLGVRRAFICFLLGMAFCSTPLLQNSAAQEKPGQTIFYTHGRMYTNDPARPWAEAMAVADGKITCIRKMAHVLLDRGGRPQGAGTDTLRDHLAFPRVY